MAKLSAIEGIGPVFAEKASAAGQGALEKLLALGADNKGRQQLAENSGISESHCSTGSIGPISRGSRALGTQHADLLKYARVDSVPELAQRYADNRHAKMLEVNTARHLVRQVPIQSLVACWVEQRCRPLVKH